MIPERRAVQEQLSLLASQYGSYKEWADFSFMCSQSRTGEAQPTSTLGASPSAFVNFHGVNHHFHSTKHGAP